MASRVSRLPGSPPITALEDFDESINMLVYGDSGAGKTVLAGTCSNGLFLATETGTIAAKRQGSTAKLWKVGNWEELQRAYKWLKDNPDHGYDWIMLDSLTAMQQLALRWILDNAVAENSSRDPDIPAIQDHQKWQNMFKRFVVSFNDLPTNVLYTATTFRVEDEEGDELILPDITGKGYGMSNWTCASMHVVGYLGVKTRGKGEEREEFRRLLCKQTPPYFGKDRYDVLVPWVDNPNMDEITKMIANSGEKSEPAPKPSRRARKATRAAVAPVVEDDPDEDEE